MILLFYFLFPIEDAYDKLADSLVPEMQRADMSVVILQLKALGIDNVLHFNFLSVSILFVKNLNQNIKLH